MSHSHKKVKKMKSRELCTYLERLRSARGISQDKFTCDIVSLRQYRRYLKGESDIPFQIIHQLSERIGIKTNNLLREFEIAKVEETNTINALYKLAVNMAHRDFKAKLKEIPLEHIIDQTNKLLYQHSVIIHQYLTHTISKEYAALQNIKLIDYPKILDQLIITSIEMLILSSLLDLLDDHERVKIADKLKSYLVDSSVVISGGNDRIYPLILYRLAKYSGMKSDDPSVIQYCDLAIERSHMTNSYFLMDYFYYFNALANRNLGHKEKSDDMLFHCYNILQFEGNKNKIKKLTELIEKDFSIDFSTFICDYIASLSSKKHQ